MIRAAAKNHAFAAVLVDPADYTPVLAELRESGGRLSMSTRERLAGKAFACTARYDAAIAHLVRRARRRGLPRPALADAYEKAAELRYGENPHQRAAYYAEVGAPTHLLAGVTQLHGKELSFNNLLDLSARRASWSRTSPSPPARSSSTTTLAAVRSARRPGRLRAGLRQRPCQRLRRRDRAQPAGRPRLRASYLAKQFIEVLLAPGFEPEALEVLTAEEERAPAGAARLAGARGRP